MAIQLILYFMLTVLPAGILSTTEANPLSGQHLRILVAEVRTESEFNYVISFTFTKFL